jgi:hypothetical protein
MMTNLLLIGPSEAAGKGSSPACIHRPDSSMRWHTPRSDHPGTVLETALRMSKAKKKRAGLSRASKTMQFEPVPPAVYEALETEAWFRRHLDSPRRRTGIKAAASDSSRAKEAIFEEALRWFLAHFEGHPPEHFERVKRSWMRAAFWLSDDVLERCRAMAQRAGVDKRQLFATALSLYCQRRVPQELVDFRQKIYSEASTLYRKHRVSVRKALRTTSAP